MILRFPGQIADAHSGLFYNYFRDYDPETGQYVESDPIGLDGGLNTYGYVEGNPVTYVDFFGLRTQGAICSRSTVGFEIISFNPCGGGGWAKPVSAVAGAGLGGVLATPKTKYEYRRCTIEETNACQAYCASTGRAMESCRSKVKSGPGVKNGEAVTQIGKLPDSVSCSCEEEQTSCPVEGGIE